MHVPSAFALSATEPSPAGPTITIGQSELKRAVIVAGLTTAPSSVDTAIIRSVLSPARSKTGGAVINAVESGAIYVRETLRESPFRKGCEGVVEQASRLMPSQTPMKPFKSRRLIS